MDFGILTFPMEGTVGPGDLARMAEDRGFESIWYPEHSHLPTASRNWPGGPDIPDSYARTLDQFVCMTAAALATERIKIASGICLVPQHHPAWLAKQVATLDHLSGGRVILGIGYGWNPAELADHGVAFADRREITREVIAAMKALWTQEIASFEGRHVTLSPCQAWPKPVQQPHPKIIVGAGAGPKLYEAVADYCDGWGPMRGRDEIVEHLAPMREAMAEAGRDPDSLDVTVFNAPMDAAELAELRDLGATRLIFSVPPAHGEAEAAMERCAQLIAEVN